MLKQEITLLQNIRGQFEQKMGTNIFHKDEE
jgi:hypothetical protein